MRACATGLRGLVGALHNFSTPVTGGKSAVLHGFSDVLVNLGEELVVSQFDLALDAI